MAATPPAASRATSRRPSGESPFPARGLSSVLRFGFLPGGSQEPPSAAAATLSSYAEVYLEEEVRREALVRDLGPFLVFLRLAATESGAQVDISKSSPESGIPAATIKNSYQVLVDTFTGFWIPPYARRWRTTGGAEVDFVWESSREDISIEVKWTERPSPADARHVESFLDAFPGRARSGFVVCRCPQVQCLTSPV